jgi:uncharacterized RDD family membrane protein YckC
MSSEPAPGISRTTRMATMLVDHFIMSLIAVVFGLPLFTLELFTDLKGTSTLGFADSMGPLEYISYVGIAFYFCKDCINGRSIAKRLFRFQVVNNTTGETASPLRCLVRNLFIIIWPVEVVVSLLNTKRRLGDLVAGTRLAVYQPKTETELKTGQIALSLIIAYAFMMSLIFVFYNIMYLEGRNNEFVERSYNAAASKKLHQLFSDSLDYKANTKVKVYDSTRSGASHYIVLKVDLNTNYLKDSKTKGKITEKIKDLIYSVYNPDSLRGDLEIIYREIGHVESQSVRLGNYIRKDPDQ